jgi:hypothetical protein
VAKRTGNGLIATADEGLAIARDFAFKEPTPIDAADRSGDGAAGPSGPDEPDRALAGEPIAATANAPTSPKVRPPGPRRSAPEPDASPVT